MLTHRGFSAWITVDGQALPEYLVAVDDEAHRVSCWIPGKEGQKFTVWWKDHGGKVDTCSFIILDGLLLPGRFLLGEGTASRSGARSGHYKERPFTFTTVPENTDDTQDSNPDVGTIVLKIKRIDRVASKRANAFPPLPSDPTIPAKRKAGDLGIGLGPEQDAPMQYPLTWEANPHDRSTVSGSKGVPTYVYFVFRYRTQEFLEAQGIASPAQKKRVPSTRPPSTVSSEPQTGDKRRIASLGVPAPSASSSALVTPSPSPPKRPRLSDQAALGLGSRRPSSDLRRSSGNYYRTPSSTQSQAQTPVPRSTSGSRTPTPSTFAAASVKTEPLENQRPHLAHQTLFLLPRTEAHQRVASGALSTTNIANVGVVPTIPQVYTAIGYAAASPGLYLPGAFPTVVATPSALASAPSMSALSDVTTPGGSEEGDSQEAKEAAAAARSVRRPSTGGRI